MMHAADRVHVVIDDENPGLLEPLFFRGFPRQYLRSRLLGERETNHFPSITSASSRNAARSSISATVRSACELVTRLAQV
jgi:hypothetical protein